MLFLNWERTLKLLKEKLVKVSKKKELTMNILKKTAWLSAKETAKTVRRYKLNYSLSVETADRKWERAIEELSKTYLLKETKVSGESNGYISSFLYKY